MWLVVQAGILGWTVYEVYNAVVALDETFDRLYADCELSVEEAQELQDAAARFGINVVFDVTAGKVVKGLKIASVAGSFAVTAAKKIGLDKVLAKLDSKFGNIGASSVFHSSGYRIDFYDASGNPVKWRNPLTGQLEDIPAGTTFHKDHIFPQAEIKKLPGFDQLTPAQQKALLNDPMNFQPLDASMNCSKGCKVEGTANEWATYKGQSISAEYKDWLGETQNNVKKSLQDKIEKWKN